jgi:hypothetical protein
VAAVAADARIRVGQVVQVVAALEEGVMGMERREPPILVVVGAVAAAMEVLVAMVVPVLSLFAIR